MSLYEKSNSASNKTEVNQFCKYCGTKIKSDFDYCKNCGRSVIDEQEIHCVKCGCVLPENIKYCPKCGKKVKHMLENGQTTKIASKKKKIILLVIAIILTLGIVTSVSCIVIPEILTTPYDIMENGDYEKAYNKANYDEKKEVLYENLVAVCCEKSIETLKYPDYLDLKNIWIDEDNNKIVLQIDVKNNNNNLENDYCLFEYNRDSNSYRYYNSISDFDKEKADYYDNSDALAGKLMDNYTKSEVMKIIQNNSLKVTNGMDERINILNQKDKLKNVELLDQVDRLYPKFDR